MRSLTRLPQLQLYSAHTLVPPRVCSTKATMASQEPMYPTMESIGVKNSNINTAAGVSLTEHQKMIVGSVLDVCTTS